MHGWPIRLVVSLSLLVPARYPAAQSKPSVIREPSPAPVVAIVGATIIPMDRERTVASQTVLVSQGRIIAVGPSDSLAVPNEATVIDGRGRYLLPGLADMHVHIMPRLDSARFRDAPLYLANGVTTVLNLAGDPIHLAMKARIEDGSLTGPTLYTSGPFVNEPVVNTPDEVEQEIRRQAAAGYDVIKFREVLGPNMEPLTRHGLSREAYHRMMETARSLSIPLTGHAPNNLGMEAVLEERQPLAHIGYTLLATWFWPRETARFQSRLRLGQWLLYGLAAIVALGWTGAGIAVLRRRGDLARALAGTAFVLTLVLAAVWLGRRELFDTDRIGQPGRVKAVTAAGVALLVGALVLLRRVLRIWRDRSSRVVRFHAVLVVAGLAASALLYWVPLARRTTDASLGRLGRAMVKSGITVITTIQVYRSSEVAGNPEVSYVSVPPWWERFRNPPPRRRVWARNLAAYLQHVTGVLQREGVPIIAGTDCGGWAFVIPGFALHDELGLMAAGGLSPYQALRTATVEPAKFLQKPEEFGTIAVGRRADLVMVESNPLENLKTLRKPVGVMARGRWFPASVLEAMLARLAPARQ